MVPEHEVPTGQVAEVFRSIQGEGLLVGRRMVFLRLAGCEIGCRYCDTEWAFQPPTTVAVPGRSGERVPNPLDVEAAVALVDAADPPDAPGGRAPVSLTGGEPLEQAAFAVALADALRPRDVMLETAALDGEALARVAPHVRWISSDLKLPSSTGLPDVLDRHAEILAAGAYGDTETFFKLIVDGDVPGSEVERAADLLASHAPHAAVFLQPVTPRGGSPGVPTEALEGFVDIVRSRGLDVRVVPQVHVQLRVR